MHRRNFMALNGNQTLVIITHLKCGWVLPQTRWEGEGRRLVYSAPKVPKCASLPHSSGGAIDFDKLVILSFDALLSSFIINPLMGTGNYSATSNNMKLVHWPLMGGLLRLVQRRRGLLVAPINAPHLSYVGHNELTTYSIYGPKRLRPHPATPKVPVWCSGSTLVLINARPG